MKFIPMFSLSVYIKSQDSLLKLKRNRKSQAPSLPGGMSDNNKIRIQLAIDIEEYVSQVL